MRKLLLPFIIFCNSVAFAQTTNQYNYVQSRTILKSGVTDVTAADALTNINEFSQTIQYIDGLGRPIQSVTLKGSPSLNDIVAPVFYDNYGRESKKYMPYVTGSDGLFKTGDVYAAQSAFYNTQKGDSKAYAETFFEPSPLNRVTEQESVGTPWKSTLNGGLGKTVKTTFRTNAANEVRIWKVDASGNASVDFSNNNGYYKFENNEGQLMVTEVTDEHGYKMREYKDKEGHVILKKVQKVLSSEAEADWISTYYVYDDLGNLRFVIPPQANKLMREGQQSYQFNFNDAFCKKYIFAYRYDARQRMSEKIVPDAGLEWFAYDKADRLVLHLKGVSGTLGWAYFYKYDALGRVIMKGSYLASYSSGTDQSTFQALADNFYATHTQNFETRTNALDYQTYQGYSNDAFPVWNTGNGSMMVTMYYDDYDFNNDGTPDFNYVPAGFSTEPVTYSAKGKPTGTKVSVVFAGMSNPRPMSVMFYDKDGRMIQTISHNSIGGFQPNNGNDTQVFGKEIVTNLYDFAGKLLESHFYQEGARNPNYVYVHKRMSYDHAGRLTKLEQKTFDRANSGSPLVVPTDYQTIAEYVYNEIGELVQKKLGKKSDGSFLQTVDMNYNIRGWLKKVNNPDDNLANSDDVFGFELFYNDAPVPQFNGNIGKQSWKSKDDNLKRNYDYTYDGLNRILSGTFTGGKAGENFSLSGMSYDDNGNIQTLIRNNLTKRNDQGKELFGVVDNLSYTYNGNQLRKVSDAAPTGLADDTKKDALAADFVDGIDAETEYYYRYDGSMTFDFNKGINFEIQYQGFIDKTLPYQIVFAANSYGPSDYIFNTYDNAGVKRKMDVYKDGSLAKTVEYAGGLVYENGDLQFIPMEEGRVLPPKISGTGQYEYEYFYKDHLGNLRTAFREGGKTYSIATMESTDNPAWKNAKAPVRSNERAYNGTYSAKLTGDNAIGPWKTLKVKQGDIINLKAYARYEANKQNNTLTNLLSLVNLIPQASMQTNREGGNNPKLLAVGLSATAPLVLGSFNWNTGSTVPKAYLQMLLTKDNANNDGKDVQKNQLKYMTTAAMNNWEEISFSYTAEADGELQVLVANESTNNIVYFDDVEVKVQNSLIVQSTHYDPWGVELAGIEKTGQPEHRYKFNGIERVDDLGLNLDMALFRTGDPQLGRWHQIDPKVEDMEAWSPYNMDFCNPVLHSDPDGDVPVPAALALLGKVISGAITGAAIELGTQYLVNGITSIATGENKMGDIDWHDVKTAAVVGGATAGLSNILQVGKAGIKIAGALNKIGDAEKIIKKTSNAVEMAGEVSKAAVDSKSEKFGGDKSIFGTNKDNNKSLAEAGFDLLLNKGGGTTAKGSKQLAFDLTRKVDYQKAMKDIKKFKPKSPNYANTQRALVEIRRDKEAVSNIVGIGVGVGAGAFGNAIKGNFNF